MNDRPQMIRTQTEIELDLGQWLENRERYVAQSAASMCGAVAPLPTIGAIGQWEPLPRVTFFGRIDWLSLTVDDYSGRLINAEASASYSLHRYFDLGVSYRFVDYELKVRRPSWTGEVDYQFSGPALFIRAGF